MKNQKSVPGRFVLLTLSLVLVLAAFTGCAKQDSHQEISEVEVAEIASRLNNPASQNWLAVQSCMKERGFEYKPNHVAKSVLSDEQRLAVAGDDRKFSEILGYGISTIIYAAPEPIEDPNEKYLGGLSQSERDEYELALWDGDRPCMDKANPNPLASAELDGKFRADMQELAQRISSDVAISEARDEWARCATGRGFDFSEPNEVPKHFSQSLLGLQISHGVIAGTPAEEFPKEYADALQALQTREIDTATELYECDKRLHQVVAETERIHEEAFIRKHFETLKEVTSSD